MSKTPATEWIADDLAHIMPKDDEECATDAELLYFALAACAEQLQRIADALEE